MIVRPATAADIPWIVDISTTYAKANVTDPKNGFIQSPLPRQLVERWIPDIVVAIIDGKGAGFAHCAPPPPPNGPRPPEPVSCYIIDNAATLQVEGTSLASLNYEFYGPALVAAEHRGKGVYGALFRHIVTSARQQHRQALVAFVDDDNPLSLTVHTHLGFKVIDEHTINGRHFHILALPLPPLEQANY